YAAGPDADQCEQVGRWLAEEVRKAPRSSSLLNSLGALRNLQGRYAEAKELALQALAVKGDDALAMNNLAYFVALEGQGEQARELLDRAEKIVGPLPDLLDTRAVAHITLKQGDKARKVLQDLLVEAPSASAHFHLAQACLLSRERAEARNALKKAREAGLKP